MQNGRVKRLSDRPPRQRRALTQARLPARVEAWGEPRAAAGLRRALEVADADPRTFTHGFHSYAARMHPETARRVLALLELPHGAAVLDPFCGSGTVLVEAARAGLAAVGLDASPLAVLVAGAKTWRPPHGVRAALVRDAHDIAARVIEEGKAARRAGHEPAGHRRGSRVPMGAFDPHVRREIEALAAEVDEAAPERADVLRAVLSAIVIKVSRRASDSRGETVKRAIGRGMAARLFADRAAELAGGLDELWRAAPRGTPPPRVALGDARRLPFADASIDAVVTSPPYAGTFDYAEHHALRLAVLGLSPEELQRREIGARRGFAADVGRALAAWERDLRAFLVETARVLREGGRAVILLGDSVAGRPPGARAVLAREVLGRLATAARLGVVAGAGAARDKLGAAERAAFGAADKREHLILLRR
jgi:SAM-dependent methyltransferase